MTAINWETILPPWLPETLPLGIFVADTELVVRCWCRSMEQYSGLPATDVVGHSLLEAFPDLSERGVDTFLKRALAGESVALIHPEYHYLLPFSLHPPRPEFDYMQQQAYLSPLVFEGEVIGVLASISDHTDLTFQQQQCEQTIRRQEETIALLDTIITKAPIGFAFLDRELRYRGINERLAALNGFSVSEHIGRSIWEIAPALAEQHAPRFEQVFATGEPLTEVELVGATQALPDQSRIWRASYYPVRTTDNRIVGAGVLITEITEQRRSEQSVQFLVGLSAALARSLDTQGTLTTLARELVPFLAEWAVVRLHWSEAEAPLSAVAHADPMREAVVRELAVRFSASQAEATAAAPAAPEDGGPTEAQLRAALGQISAITLPLMQGEQIIGTLALGRSAAFPPYSNTDLSVAKEVAERASMALHQARLFAEAQQSRALAEEALRMRDTFFSLAAHELRTPLTTLLGRAQLLQKWVVRSEASDERSLRAVGIVVEQAQRLNQMITALLDISRIQSGRFSIVPAQVNLSALVRRVIDEWQLASGAHQLSFEEPDGTLHVLGDEVRLEQVLQSLFSNAVKYSPGGSTIRITLSREPEQAALAVYDEGIGIPEAARGQLFRRFYRAENAEQLGISGLGIGLFVANEIVELHGGRIDVESAEGQGSTFTIRLPLA